MLLNYRQTLVPVPRPANKQYRKHVTGLCCEYMTTIKKKKVVEPLYLCSDCRDEYRLDDSSLVAIWRTFQIDIDFSQDVLNHL